jgi:hypothetical protein
MSSAEKPLIAFRRLKLAVPNYQKILWKGHQSDYFELKFGNLTIGW